MLGLFLLAILDENQKVNILGVSFLFLKKNQLILKYLIMCFHRANLQIKSECGTHSAE